jgi:Na+/melibiose symporter-like transporter
MGTEIRNRYARWLPATMLAFCGVMMAAGIACGFFAWRRASLPFALTGVILLLAAPPLAVLALLARNLLPSVPDGAHADTLIDGMHRADSTLRMIRKARAHLGVAAATVFLAWVCEACQLTHFPDFAICLTLLVAIAAAGYMPWLARQEKFVRDLREQLHGRLIATSVVEKWFAG